MATIDSREMVDEIIANDGYYEGDPRIVKIVEYENIFNGKLAYGLIYKGENLMRYQDAHAATINPRVIWEAK